jgi:hypothetical protein
MMAADCSNKEAACAGSVAEIVEAGFAVELSGGRAM